MAAYATLKAAIDQFIKANGNKEITGPILNNILTTMINTLGEEYFFAGVATPSTSPGQPEQKVVYFASQAGTYTNFGAVTLPAGIHLLMWNGTSWSHQTFFTIDSEPTFNSVNLVQSNGVYRQFYNNDYCAESFVGTFDISGSSSGDVSISPAKIKGGSTYLICLRTDKEINSNSTFSIGFSGNSSFFCHKYLCTNNLWFYRKTVVSAISAYTRIFISWQNMPSDITLYYSIYRLNGNYAYMDFSSVGTVSLPYTISLEDAKIGKFYIEYNTTNPTKLVTCNCNPKYVKHKQGGLMTIFTENYTSELGGYVRSDIRRFYYVHDDVLVDYGKNVNIFSVIDDFVRYGDNRDFSNNGHWITGVWSSKNNVGDSASQTAIVAPIAVIRGHYYRIYIKPRVAMRNYTAFRVGLSSNDSFVLEEGIPVDALNAGIYLTKVATTTVDNARVWIVMDGGDEGVLMDVAIQDITDYLLASSLYQFDISELNATENPHTLATYEDLVSALNALPASYRKSGMSVKFVRTSDNKYVQWRYLLSSVSNSDFKNVNNWQGVDDEPTEWSRNLVESGGVNKQIIESIKPLSSEKTDLTQNAYAIGGDGKFNDTRSHYVIPVNAEEKYILENAGNSVNFYYAFATSDIAVLGENVPIVDGTSIMRIPAYSEQIIEIPQGCTFLLVNKFNYTKVFTCYSKIEKDNIVTKNSNNAITSNGVFLSKFSNGYCEEVFEGEYIIDDTAEKRVNIDGIKGGDIYLLCLKASVDISTVTTDFRFGFSGNSAISMPYLCENEIWISRRIVNSSTSQYAAFFFRAFNLSSPFTLYYKVYRMAAGCYPFIGTIENVTLPFVIPEESAKIGKFYKGYFDKTVEEIEFDCNEKYIKKLTGGIMVGITKRNINTDSRNDGKLYSYYYIQDNTLVSYPTTNFPNPFIEVLKANGQHTVNNSRGWLRGKWLSNNRGLNNNQTAFLPFLTFIKGRVYVVYAKSEQLITPIDETADVSIRIGLGSNDALLDDDNIIDITPQKLYNGVYMSKVAHTTANYARVWIAMSNGSENVPVNIYIQDITDDLTCQEIQYSLECSAPPKLSLPYRGNRINSKYITLGIPYKITEDTSGSSLTHSSQGSAILGNYLFRLFVSGYCVVYDISDYKNYVEVARFPLGSYSINPENHANSAQFGNNIAEGSNFPLLYVETNGYSPNISTTHVEKIKVENGVWSSETVQTIYIDNTTISEINSLSQRQDELDVFSSSGIMLYAGTIGDDGCLHSIGYDTKKNILHIIKWRLPNITNTEYRLTGNDVIIHCIKQGFYRSAYVNQGHCFYNNQYFQVFGGTISDSNIEVYDFNRDYSIGDDIVVKTIININSVYGEPEDIDVHCENLIVPFNNAKWMIEIKK